MILHDSLVEQFAGAVYGPIVARGIAAWQGDDGNYWGHNAIVRMRAFAAAVNANGEDRFYCALPLYHIFAFTVCMLVAFRLGGSNILIVNPRDLPAVFKDLRRGPFHVFPAVNTLFGAMAHHPEFPTVDWSSLVLALGGGMAVQQATAKLWLDKTGTAIIEGYGLSETSPVVSFNPAYITEFTGTTGLPKGVIWRQHDLYLASNVTSDPPAAT